MFTAVVGVVAVVVGKLKLTGVVELNDVLVGVGVVFNDGGC